eukprot:gnl/MRDRNA2_/MRDRNA2_57270_c0_seq1.p1 gnl/MRDRNA2_/MRDRNA2_57270_c0~~gnl/MRDRNA2_/MRDRNA2_57270_c0_seq1.p1  ORF type:complete len:641 (-),score=116.43 gnl/MRDRNA2_/MRDRNA2_57270_c0_seq1:297-2219(-)
MAQRILTLYGSQTGTAEEVAWDLSREGRRRQFPCALPKALDDVDITTLSSTDIVIIVVATTGQGDPPVNMKRLWDALTDSSLSPTTLSSLQYAVFGLGDSHYREFNYAARKMHARLRMLGAKPFVRLGLGDDQHDFGLEQELDPWAEEMWDALLEICPHVKQCKALPVDVAPEPRYKVQMLEVGQPMPEPSPRPTSKQSQGETSFCAEVVANDQLTAKDYEQDVRAIRLAAKELEHYQAGDVAVVWPRIEQKHVRSFIEECLGMEPEMYVRISTVSSELGSTSPFPLEPLTLVELFSKYVDISAVPSRFFFHVLSFYTDPLHKDHEVHRAKLREFSSRTLEAKDALYEYCRRERRNMAEVMWDFHSSKPPLGALLSAAPLLRPRRYSIASCPRWYDHTAADFWLKIRKLWTQPWCRFESRIAKQAAVDIIKTQHHPKMELCVAVVDFKTKFGRHCKGLCSSFLADQPLGTVVHCSLEKGSLSLPAPEVPLIMVCPGTGLSPCRALIQQRHLLHNAKGPGYLRHRDLLFLGFRHQHQDFLYGDEWQTFDEWLSVHVAFSRDDPDRKVYVQDLIETHGADVCNLIHKGAYIFICGRSHPMPSQVFNAFVEVLQIHSNLTEEEAAQYLKEMKREGRYVCDTWG